jgi:predicted RNA polymerase sigma factor
VSTADPAGEGWAREHAPRVLAALVRRTGDFAAAEDALQEALLAATVQWPAEGVPINPSGWLYPVATRRLADFHEAEAARARREAEVASEAGERVVPPPELPEPVPDETLQLLYLCCHPALSAAAAVPLVLRAVAGLTTAEIARAFFASEATMAQRIVRAKQIIRASGLPFAGLDSAARDERLAAVLHVLYLLFNEGYAASAGEELVRVDLSQEALRLARLVHALAPEHPESTGLLALLLLTDARRAARTGQAGELIPLHEQDRTRWDRAAIAEGTALVTEALARGAVGPYQLQAAIAALHDEAPSLEATDWPQILALYGLLARLGDNPAVALNRAVALAMVHGPAAGLEALRSLDGDPVLTSGHRLAAVRGHLYERLGERERAVEHYREAAARAANLAERRYLEYKAAKLA